MKNPSPSRTRWLVWLSAATFIAFGGCASSKMTSKPQATASAESPTKEYEWHDMSTGKFFGPALSKTAQSQPTPQQ